MTDGPNRLARRNASVADFLGAAAVIAVVLAPLIAISVFPESALSRTLFGTTARITLFYVVTVGGSIWYGWRDMRRVLLERQQTKR